MNKLAESRHVLKEAVSVTAPFIASASEQIPTAIAAANLYRAWADTEASTGACIEALKWRAREESLLAATRSEK